ncbi:DUF3822 family protein [bacterium SCSIO 12741]|nr:DUF3822 family protein [bacterium SCSIO 12741]
MAGNYSLWGSWLPGKLTLAVIDEEQCTLLGLHEIPFSLDKWDARTLRRELQKSPLYGADYGRTSFLIFTESSSLLPACDEETAQTLFKEENPNQEESKWLYHPLPRIQSQVVAKASESVFDFLSQNFPDASFRHYTGAAIEEGLFVSKKQSDILARLIIQPDSVHVILLDQGKLLFCNRFLARVTEDVLYYLFFALEQLEINRDDVVVMISGHQEALSLNLDMLKEYLPRVEHEAVDPSLSVSLIHDPVANRNLSLLNLFLCE